MTSKTSMTRFLHLKALSACALAALIAGCGGGGTASAEAEQASGVGNAFQVGTTSTDANLPAEPALPADTQVCATLEASNKLVKRPDGALPPEADPSVSGVGVAVSATTANPDQARIQAALDVCGAAVDAEVGAAIASADAAATAQQKAAADPTKNISGISGEELAKAQYRASKFAVRLVVSSSGAGNAFISGPLTLPSGVTLWIDKGVTLFASRDVMAYSPKAAGPYCANTAVSATKAGSSGNCAGLINGDNLVNSAVVGDGAIDSRGYAEIVTTNKLYPLMKVDMSCSNTYAAYAQGLQAADGTACDDGGTVVDSKSSVRNMTWWDLAYLGNMVQNGTTGTASQSNFRMIGSETNSGVKNVHVYDNSFDGSEEGLRIKSDYARGGEVSNIYVDDICMRNVTNALLYTPYYSTKALPASGPLVPNFHDIFLSNISLQGQTAVTLRGFAANTGGFNLPAYPLVMSLTNVVTDSPDAVSVIASDAQLTLDSVNLPILPSADNRVSVTGTATRSVPPSKVVDCSRAYVDFPSSTSPAGTGW